uniref:Telomeric single stranded DNA binding POT1/Cdc13 domain-containing protein n=1 Tax=Guillardia theta TaxID=55529 RepID=A0A7S4KUC2_GUITH|mmetsp:Transcript_31314/g.100452  ORF Transcript_31314/g.100452 Transcript_31314/m.100452 type:complete len:738 (+) Transcript_31314:114-2327(+)
MLTYRGEIVFVFNHYVCKKPRETDGKMVERREFSVMLRNVESRAEDKQKGKRPNKQSSFKKHPPREELRIFFWDDWADACKFLKVGNVIECRGFRKESPMEESQSQLNLDPASLFKDGVFELHVDNADPDTGRRLFCDNNGWEVEINDKTLDVQINEKEWERVRRKVGKKQKDPAPIVYAKLNELEKFVEGNSKNPLIGRHENEASSSSAANAPAQEPNRLNFYGIVVDYSHPKKTKGPDFCTTLTVVDETMPKGVRINLFMDEKSSPVVRSIGDVIRIHRVKVVEFDGGLQVQRGPGCNFCLFSPSDFHGKEVDYDSDEVEEDIQPYQCRTHKSGDTKFIPRPGDRKSVMELSAWGENFLATLPPNSDAGQDEYVKKLCHITDLDKPFDIYCSLNSQLPSDNGWMYFRVWDGSDLPLQQLENNLNQNLKSGEEVSERMELLQHHPGLPFDGAVPSLGSLLVIGLEVKALHNELIQSIKFQGSAKRASDREWWCKIRNLRLQGVEVNDGNKRVLMGILSDKSSVMTLPSVHWKICKLKAEYDRRVSQAAGPSGGGAAGEQGLALEENVAGPSRPKRARRGEQPINMATSAWFGAAPLSSIAQILQAVREEPCGKFRCRVMCESFSPRKASEFVRWSRLERQYVCIFDIAVKDATGSLLATVAYEDFEDFTGVKQKEMNSEEAQKRCEQALQKIVNPACRVELCLKSFQKHDGQVYFRVFATEILAKPRALLPGEEGA